MWNGLQINIFQLDSPGSDHNNGFLGHSINFVLFFLVPPGVIIFLMTWDIPQNVSSVGKLEI